MEKDNKKELKLRMNQVKRLMKEYISYEKEVEVIVAKIAELVENNEEEYYINKQV